MKKNRIDRNTNRRKAAAIKADRKAKAAGEHIKKNAGDELVVIRDPYNKKDFYMMMIDNFVLAKVEYAVMYNYVPDDGNHRKPELVIMRTTFSDNGEQFFYSIKDGAELERAFVLFMRRYYGSSVPDKKSKNGIATGGI